MGMLRRLWNTVRPGRMERDIEREVAFHLAERADQLQAEGLSEGDALRQARLQFGNVALEADRTRDMDVSLLVDALVRDARYAIRSLLRAPGFTLTVTMTLALSIGANSAVFSALNAVLLRPLPFPDADRLMQLDQRLARTAETLVAPVRLEDWNRLNHTFTAMTGYYGEDFSEMSGEFPERLRRAQVAPRFFDVWGVSPAIGRGFSLAEHRVGGPPAVVISHRYWRQRLGSDPDVLNRTVRIGTTAVPIIGVMPASFLFPDREVDVWSPVPLDAEFTQSRKATWYIAVGRLEPGITAAQARADLATVQQQLAAQFGDPDTLITVDVTALKATTVAGARRSLLLLFGGVSVLLLIACANIAALLLTRGSHRQHELGVRLSLGASHAALARQILVETLALTIAGGGLGLLLAVGGVRVLRSATIDLPRLDEIAVDWRIVAYTLLTSVIAAIVCAALPVWRALAQSGHESLREGGRGLVSSRYRIQRLLVGAEIALSVMLLVGAGLLGRSFQELWRADSGFNTRNVLAFRVSGNWAETTEPARLAARIDTTLEKLRALPGVEAAATTGWALPGVPTHFETTFSLREAQNDEDRRLVAEARSVSPEYFATMQIPLLAGELCRRPAMADATARLQRDVMVNATFAERYFSGSSPLGRHLTQADIPLVSRIVGIVGDARERGLDREPGATVYWCDPAPNPTPYFLARTTTAPAALVQPLRLAMKELEPLRAIYELGALEQRLDGAFAQNRWRAVLLVLFAATALSLAAVGVYGTLSYAVSLRRREVALRLALGARHSGVVRQFLMEALRVIVCACALGLAGSLAVSRVLVTMLVGVSPTDPATLLAVCAVVMLVGTLAAIVPALRASRLQAMEVLRET